MSETNIEYQAKKKYPYSENSFLFPFILGRKYRKIGEIHHSTLGNMV